MAAASVGAFCIGEYPEAAAAMLLFQVGEFFEDYAENRSHRSISALMKLSPDSVSILVDGAEKTVPAKDVKIGDIILLSLAAAAEAVGQSLGLDAVHAALSPEDKLEKLSEYKREGVTLFTGDGVCILAILNALRALRLGRK